MKFDIQKWTVKDLLDLYESKKLNLNPPYQRNPIWTIKAQRKLIDSIILGYPLPTFFILKKSANKYEMVDGQQRTRALLAFKNTSDLDNKSDIKNFKKKAFLEYLLPITLIMDIQTAEYIEVFYDLVNSQGLRLNRPETLKAKYFNTIFLDLVEKLAALDKFAELELVPPNSQKRMQDRDLVEELIALLIYGNTDKKHQVDKMYETDINKVTAYNVALKFEKILDHLNRFNAIKEISETRYRQRNDIYTLFGFLNDNINIQSSVLNYFYKILITIETEIKPSKIACPPLANYAYACVSQSNSAKSRDERLRILNNILTNTKSKPNETQIEIISYYSLEPNCMIKKGDFLTFDITKLKLAIKEKSKEISDSDY